MSKDNDTVSGTVTDDAVAVRAWDDSALRDMNDFNATLAILSEAYGLETVESYGTGFEPIDKRQLVDVPFVIVQYGFHKGDYGDYAFVHAVTKRNEKVIFSDGSVKSGIARQLADITAEREKNGRDTRAGILVGRGLRISEYEYTDPGTGEVRPAETYYLSM